jgi:ribosomal protein L37E
LDENEYPDIDEDDETTISCPECGADVFDDAEQCPACGWYIVQNTRVWSGKSAWWIALGILGIVAVILALAFGF